MEQIAVIVWILVKSAWRLLKRMAGNTLKIFIRFSADIKAKEVFKTFNDVKRNKHPGNNAQTVTWPQLSNTFLKSFKGNNHFSQITKSCFVTDRISFYFSYAGSLRPPPLKLLLLPLIKYSLTEYSLCCTKKLKSKERMAKNSSTPSSYLECTRIYAQIFLSAVFTGRCGCHKIWPHKTKNIWRAW